MKTLTAAARTDLQKRIAIAEYEYEQHRASDEDDTLRAHIDDLYDRLAAVTYTYGPVEGGA